VLRCALVVAAVSQLLVSTQGYTERKGAQVRKAYVVLSPEGSFNVNEQHGDEGVPSSAVAWAAFEDGLHETGWGVIDIETNPVNEDRDQAYAAGLLEGVLTARHIYDTAANVAQVIFKQHGMPDDVHDFMEKQENWSREQVKVNPDDPLFRQLGYLLRQYDGLVDGFNTQTPAVPFLGSWAFQMLNGVGDLFDIIPAVQSDKVVDPFQLNRTQAELFHALQGHCSAIVKLPGDFSDLLLGHSSWYAHENTNRIFKHYKLNFNDSSTAAKTISFSSYPGFLESLDDFYMLDSGLTWTQTSLPVMNKTLHTLVHHESLLAWQRVRVASAMAHTGKEWYQVFKKHHSGTYSNQYMIVDMNLFEPNRVLKDNLLWVIEEIPGYITGADQTDVLRAASYWPSYNVPYYKEVFNRSGYGKMEGQHGNFWTYTLNPRGQLFRRDHGQVNDLDSLKTLLRSNKFEKDPYSFDGKTQNPNYAICSRGDLADNPTTGGCYDTKVTSYLYGAKSSKAQIINGPTTNGGSLKAFTWADFPNHSHVGLPEIYDFDFVHTEPRELKRPPQAGKVQLLTQDAY